MGFPIRGLLALLALGAVPEALRAQQPNHLYDRHQLAVAAAAVRMGSVIRVDTDEGDGTEIDSEEDLGLDRTSLRPRFAYRWRPGRRHQLEAVFLPVTRSGSRILEKDLAVDSVTFGVGAELESRIRTDQVGVNYRYALHAGERTVAGLSAGLGLTFLRARFTGTGTASGGGGEVSGDFTVEPSVNAPSLALGGFGHFRVGDRWYVEGELGGFYVDAGGVQVRIVQLLGAVRYFPLAWLGVEAGYSLNAQRVDVEQGDDPLVDLDFRGRLKYTTQNLRLAAVATF